MPSRMFEPTGVFQAIDPDGNIWSESSDEEEVRERARTGDTIRQLYIRKEYEWREE